MFTLPRPRPRLEKIDTLLGIELPGQLSQILKQRGAVLLVGLAFCEQSGALSLITYDSAPTSAAGGCPTKA